MDREYNEHTHHYLDNSATTRVSEAAAKKAYEAMRTSFGNPSSLHELGYEAEEIRETARRQVADALGASADEVFFTSCGSEADNWALRCGVEANKRVGKHVITTAVEHAAILNTVEKLRTQGYEITLLPPTSEGGLDYEALEAALREDTCLVSVMMVNNEVGTVTDVTKVREILKRKNSKALLHTDAVQGFLKVPFKASTLGADLISISGHKVHAPKGIGALYIKKGLRLPPFILGGGQERGLRSGTESVPLIAAFGTAAQEGSRTFKQSYARMTALKENLKAQLAEMDGVYLNGSDEAPHVLSLCMPGCPSEVTMRILESHQVYVSAGSACSRGHRSHVLEAMNVPSERIDSTIRVSFCEDNTQEDVDELVAGLKEAQQRLLKRK